MWLNHPCDKEAQSPFHASVGQEMCEGPGAAMSTSTRQNAPREQHQESLCPSSTRKRETEGSEQQLCSWKGSGHSRKVCSLQRGMDWDNHLSSSPEELPILWHLGALLPSGFKISSVFLRGGAQLV